MVSMEVSCASAHACPQMTKWLKTCYSTSRSGGKKKKPFNSILKMDPCFKCLPKGFNYIANRNRQTGLSSDWNFLIWKGQQNKYQSVTHDLASSLVYKPYHAITGITILSPTTELILAVQCFPVVSVWIRSYEIVERSLQKQSITSPPLCTCIQMHQSHSS